MTAHPIPDMSSWTILDYELAFDGIHMVNDACVGLQNQPRSALGFETRPGAAFIADLGEDWCASVLDAMMRRLEVVRFDTAGAEDQRIRLLVRYHADFGAAGESMSDILEMMKGWVAPIAA